MAALTAAKEAERQDGEILVYPVNGGSIIYKGALVCVDADGYLIPGSDTAGVTFVGVAVETVDNSAGADGDKECRVYKTGVFKVAKAAAAQTDVGTLMYILDDATVASTSTNSIKAGYVTEIIDSSNLRIRIDTVVQ